MHKNYTRKENDLNFQSLLFNTGRKPRPVPDPTHGSGRVARGRPDPFASLDSPPLLALAMQIRIIGYLERCVPPPTQTIRLVRNLLHRFPQGLLEGALFDRNDHPNRHTEQYLIRDI